MSKYKLSENEKEKILDYTDDYLSDISERLRNILFGGPTSMSRYIENIDNRLKYIESKSPIEKIPSRYATGTLEPIGIARFIENITNPEDRRKIKNIVSSCVKLEDVNDVSKCITDGLDEQIGEESELLNRTLANELIMQSGVKPDTRGYENDILRLW